MNTLFIAIKQAQTRLALLTLPEKKALLSRILDQLVIDHDRVLGNVGDEQFGWIHGLIRFVGAALDNIAEMDNTDLCEVLDGFAGFLRALEEIHDNPAERLTIH